MLSVKNQMLLVIGFLVLALLSQSLRIIPAGRTGVIFNLKGGVQNNYLSEGMHFLIPFVQTLIVFDTRIVTYSFTSSTDDAYRLGDPIIAKTKDGQVVGIEASIVAQLKKERVPEIYQKLRTDYEPVLNKKTSQIMQEVVASHVADALYTKATREQITQEVVQALSSSLSEMGINLYDVLLRKIDFSKEYIEAIESKQIALQKAQLAQIYKDIAVKEKQIEIIKGEAKAKEVEIKGSAIQANPRLAELEYLDYIEQNKLEIPVIMGLQGSSFINLDKIMTK
jgi:prohibitin 2